MIEIRRLTDRTEIVVATVSDVNAEQAKAVMGMDEVTLNLVTSTPLDLQIRDFIRVDGEVYSLNRNPEFTLESEVEYQYTMVFESPVYNLMDKLYKSKLQGESRFTLTGTLEDFVDLLLWNINQDEFDRGWEKSTNGQGKPEIVATEMKNLTFDSESCYGVLARLANEFDVEYRVKGRQIAFEEKVEEVRDLKFEQGCGNGLYTLKRQNVDTENTVTRAYVYGSMENLPSDYRGGGKDRLLPADENGEVIPHFDNTVDYDKIVERDVFFDDVKPSFTGGIKTVGGVNNKVFTCPEIDFDLNDKSIVIGDQGRVNFLTGGLMGIGFRFTYNHSRKEITLLEQEDETATTGPAVRLPSNIRKPAVGDKFNFTGIRLPAAYITAAEKRLAEKGCRWMEVYSKLRVKYNLDVDYRYLREKGITLDVGDVVKIGLPGGGEQQLRITSLRRQLATGQLNCEVSNYLPVSWEKQIEGKIQEARSSVELSKSEVLYSINATKEWVGRYFARLADQMADGQAIVWDDVRQVIRTISQVPDAVLWDGLKVSDWLDQAVRTTDPVKFKKVVAEELIEQTDEPQTLSEGEVAMLLVEDGPGGETIPTTLGQLENVEATVDGVGEEDVVLFRSKGREQWTLKLLSEIGGGGSVGIQRNVRIVNNLAGKNIAASKGEPCYLNFTFISQERYSSDEPYEDTGERGLLQVFVKSSNAVEYTVVKELYLNSGTPFSLDVARYLTSGANQVMVKVTGEVTEMTTPAFVYTVQLTTLSVSADNFKWWTAYLGDITLPLNIGGNISKVLYVSITGSAYSQTYSIPIGTGIYTETAYNYVIPHPGQSGVYQLTAYVSNIDGTIQTKRVSFQVICAVAGESVKLIALNKVLEKATNWAENALFDYTMYDGDNVTTAARFVVTRENQRVFVSDESSISASTRYTFSLPLEIDTLDNSEFTIQVQVLDGEAELTDPLRFTVNNSMGYSAVAGATLYINPKTRSNRQENYKQMINEMTGGTLAATWQGMNWGNDGWVIDTDGNRVLRLMAGARLSLDYYPFARECARTGKTLEIDYRVDHVTDYAQPLLTISAPSSDSFVGLNVYADEVLMHSQSLKNDRVQSLHTFEGRRTRLTLTILPAAYGNPGFNLCILYIDGVKNREFTYEDNDYFAQNGGIVIGSDFADVDIYGIREYNSGLTSQGVLTNYINWLADTNEKARVKLFNDILDSNGSEVDFENTKDQFNVLVFDHTIPGMADQSSRSGTLEVLFREHPEWNVSISGVTAKGQGTSSMKYWIWNTRYQLDKNLSVITHADGSTTTGKWQMTPFLPAGQKFTAKKNFASSMQSHKIGAVNSYNDLYREMGFSNEAMQTSTYDDARVAVYQMPFFCFEKAVNEDNETIYTFRGLYTFGPDKGDKYTFGFDTDLFPNLISIEGSDNSPLCTLFRVPWNNNVTYNESEEAYQYNGANSWDFGEGEIEHISKFIPAYNIVYQCSPRLKPFQGSVDELNAQTAELRTQPYEYWMAKAGDVHQYQVYYFETSQNKFIPSDIGEGAVNLYTQLVDKGYGLRAADVAGKTAEDLNALFIRARIAKFRMEAARYWDIEDALFFMNNVEFNAGTDERAKNTYPYSFGTDTSLFRWRVDDADTRFDITNRGLPEKGYGVETHDVDTTGAAVWNGETNNFFNLMELAFPAEKTAGMRDMMMAMESLGKLKSGDDLEKLYAFFQKYYFDEAQEYFPDQAYNADAKYCYENGKLAYSQGIYSNDTDPITQSLGDHYLAEQRWITKRIIYMMSKYSFGLFSANGTDSITVRAAGNTITYQLTPAMDLYPAIANGTSIIQGARTRAGEVCEMEIELSGTGDQQNAIMGASYLMDIGDWHDKNVSGSMIIQGKMLREIRLGSQTQPIVISISSLTISNCISLQKLVLSNIQTLAGTLNLTSCTHLQEVYADGTSLVQMKLPVGGGLRKVEFSGYNQYLMLSDYPLMTNTGVGIELCKGIITDFFVVNCLGMQPMQILADIVEAQTGQGNDHALKRIRVVGFEETYHSSDILEKLALLADGSYCGLSSEGISGEDEYPVLDGTLNVYANAYTDDVEALRNTFKKLILQVTGKVYLRFADSLVKSICLSKWDLDRDGYLTREETETVTYIDATVFKGKEIISFDEFGDYFRNVTKIGNSCFENCTHLTSIQLPGSLIEIGAISFQYCSDLKYVQLPDSVTTIGENLFAYCLNLETVKFPALLTNLSKGCFYQCDHLKSVQLPQNLIEIPDRCFKGCYSLESVEIPGTVTKIGLDSFINCSSLTKIRIPGSVKLVMGAAFIGCTNLLTIIFEDGEEPLVIQGAYWIQNTSVKTVVLPSNISSIGDYFVRDSVLADLYVKATIPASLRKGWADDYNKINLYVPIGCREAYANATNWSLFKTITEYDFDNDPDRVVR